MQKRLSLTSVYNSMPRHIYKIMRKYQMIFIKNSVNIAAIALIGVILAACNLLGDSNSNPSVAVDQSSVIGYGPVKVTMLLPMTANGNLGKIAREMRNAAAMAINDNPNSRIQIIVKNTAPAPGMPSSSASIAALQGINEGSRLILGPISARAVASTSQVTSQAGIPIISFSSDPGVASPNTFLLSFLPQDHVRRIVEYAARSGIRSIAALVADDTYGNLALASLQNAASDNNISVALIRKYDPGSRSSMANSAAEVAQQARGANPRVTAIFMPDLAARSIAVAGYLINNGVNTSTVKLLGTGRWDDDTVMASQELQNAWYASQLPTGFDQFARRYQAQYGAEPSRIVSLAYDAVKLASSLFATRDYLYDTDIANGSYFHGIDGIFRFKKSGVNQYGIAVLTPTTAGPRVIDPAPNRF